LISFDAIFGFLCQSARVSTAKELFPRRIQKSPSVARNVISRRASSILPVDEDRWDVLHPHSIFRYYWDLTTLFMMAWVVIDVPFMVAFDVRITPHLWDWHRIVSFSVDVFFMADVVINFNTGVEVNGKVSLNRNIIARDYIRTWFVVDIVSAFPLDLVLDNNNSAVQGAQLAKIAKIGRIVRMFKLVRLLRIARVARITSRLEYTMSTQEAIRTLWKFFIVVLLCCHLFTCLFYGIGATYNDSVEWANGIDESVDSYFSKYVAGFYW
jgi:hypothetical protein